MLLITKYYCTIIYTNPFYDTTNIFIFQLVKYLNYGRDTFIYDIKYNIIILLPIIIL